LLNNNLLQQLQNANFNQSLNSNNYNNTNIRNSQGVFNSAFPQQTNPALSFSGNRQTGQNANVWPQTNTTSSANESYLSNLLLNKLAASSNMPLMTNDTASNQLLQQNMLDYNLNMMNYLSSMNNSAAAATEQPSSSLPPFLANSLDHRSGGNQSGSLGKKQHNQPSLNANSMQNKQQSNPSIWSYPSSSNSQNNK
jgi:hypothetical protein